MGLWPTHRDESRLLSFADPQQVRVLGTESVSCVDKLNFLTRVGKPQASFVLYIEAGGRGPYEWRFLTVTTATRALCG
jgi:hypothetical protein